MRSALPDDVWVAPAACHSAGGVGRAVSCNLRHREQTVNPRRTHRLNTLSQSASHRKWARMRPIASDANLGSLSTRTGPVESGPVDTERQTARHCTDLDRSWCSRVLCDAGYRAATVAGRGSARGSRRKAVEITDREQLDPRPKHVRDSRSVRLHRQQNLFAGNRKFVKRRAPHISQTSRCVPWSPSGARRSAAIARRRHGRRTDLHGHFRDRRL